MIIHNENSDALWRKELVSQAQGKVLEVSVGTGVNFIHYPPGVFVTASDLSYRMIGKARQQASNAGVPAEFHVASVENLQFPAQSFDTILSTLSLCAYENPALVLNLFNTWCKPDGKILLLEHGLSDWRIVRWVQHLLEPVYYRQSGCHLDRDIYSILVASPLRIVKIERRLAGVLVMVCLEPVRGNR